jgi:ankyrin repeat protein
VNTCDDILGRSPRWIAADNQNAACLNKLADFGAYGNICDNEGRSPVFAAGSMTILIAYYYSCQ